MTTPAGVDISASVGYITNGLDLENFVPKFWVAGFQKFGSNIQVISNDEISLRCGATAYKTKIEWLWNTGIKMTSVIVSTFKNDKYVFLAAHPWRDVEGVLSIVESLQME